MLGRERQKSNEFESGVGYAGVDDRCRGRIKIRVSEDDDHNQRLCDDHMYYNRDIGADAGCWRSKRVMISINLGLGMPVLMMDAGS